MYGKIMSAKHKASMCNHPDATSWE